MSRFFHLFFFVLHVSIFRFVINFRRIKIFFVALQVDCPDGQLSKLKILDMYSMILPAGNAQVFVDQIFRIFDKDGNGSIDFKVRLVYCIDLEQALDS